ncbi:ribonuclease Y [Patescibacteria group bacterium AH-259-L07]|nr:ribonuclease Y [Patescibacteria group bacterium AH-259-L07]
MTTTYFFFALAIIFGALVGWTIRHYSGIHQTNSAEVKAKEILSKAKVKQQEIFFKAREQVSQILEDAKKEEERRRRDLRLSEQKLEKRQSIFEKKIFEMEERQRSLLEKSNRLEAAKKKIIQIYEEAKEELQKVAEMTRDEARQALMDDVEKKIKGDILARIKKLEQYGSEEMEKKAKNMLTEIIERCAGSHVAEVTTATVSLPSDEMKGRIIGREGRNIRVFEQLTGAEIVIDDTPEIVLVSVFNPIRRHLAKRALEKLILDGRIQPARIEKVVEDTKKELVKDIKKAGEDAVYTAGIAGLDPKIIQALGRLKFRTSYGQNVLLHSIEVANLAEMLAQKLDADVSVAKKAGLLHDIGKALDFETEGTHIELGKELARKYGISDDVVTAAMEHHEDHPSTLEGVIVKVADALSGARPGARRDSYEQYVKRLEELEDLAKGFEGIEKAYAIQAGRELRVFVRPEQIDDLKAHKLAQEIANSIEKELTYPGEIKVTVIRENRVTEYAR